MGRQRGERSFGGGLRLRGLRVCGALLACVLLSACDPRWFEGGGGGGGGSPVTSPITGTWTGSIPLASYRIHTFSLSVRPNGEVLGYVMGGTRHRTIIQGSHSGSQVSLTFEKVDHLGPQVIEITGTVDGDEFTGTTPFGSFTLVRDERVLVEENFVFLYPPTPIPIELSVVTTETGEFVSGGFVTTPGFGCNPLVCGGGLTDFSLDDGVLTIGLESGGTGATCNGTQATGSITGTYNDPLDPQPMAAPGAFVSTFEMVNCDGGNPRSGHLDGYRRMGTDSQAIEQVLAAFGRLADDLDDTGTPLSAPHPSFHSAYFHQGKDLTDLFGEYEVQRADKVDYGVQFNRFASLFTEVRPFTLTYFAWDPQVLYRETGTWVGAGSPDEASGEALKWLELESGAWRFRGNDASGDPPVTRLPFEDVLSCSTGTCDVVGMASWGIRDQNHLSGHEGIDLRFQGSAWLVAGHAGRIADIIEYDYLPTGMPDGIPEEVAILLVGDTLASSYAHLEVTSICCGVSECSTAGPGAVELCVDDMVAAGQRIGRSGRQELDGTTHLHWDTRPVGQAGKPCPWEFLDAPGQVRLVDIASDLPWRGWLEEPLLCNDGSRTDASYASPLVTRWELVGGEAGAPESITFTRESPNGVSLYEIVEPGQPAQTGAACLNGTNLDLAPGENSCAMGGSVDTDVTFQSSGSSAEMTLSIAGGPTGTYHPVFVLPVTP